MYVISNGAEAVGVGNGDLIVDQENQNLMREGSQSSAAVVLLHEENEVDIVIHRVSSDLFCTRVATFVDFFEITVCDQFEEIVKHVFRFKLVIRKLDYLVTPSGCVAKYRTSQ